MATKELFYDWVGANEWLFQQVNALHGQWYDDTMVAISHLADYHNFPYYLTMLAIYVAAEFVVRKIAGHGGAKQTLIGWAGVFAVLFAGFAVEAGTIKLLKEEFAYPRPYIALAGVHVLDYKGDHTDDYHSFPSGHASFATLMVAALWPMLCMNLRSTGVFLVPLVCWSRMAMGMHFPADVLGGVVITLIEVLLVRAAVYHLLRKIGIRC